MYTHDMIKYMLCLAAFMCVFKTKKRLTSDFGMPGGALYNLPFGMQCRDRDTDPIRFSSFQNSQITVQSSFILPDAKIFQHCSCEMANVRQPCP